MDSNADRNTHFVAYEFRVMIPTVTDITSVTTRVAEIHKNCISPRNQFGIPYPAFDGCKPQ
ncbi:uncharacterized protein BCR38DRAFT_217547 [Pseudomassariella vexata]|uniref:Uncharacterized protein n=1 Tax=Pseudomassariella vexata TaxID=1141098 RepID=A0A1Y2DUK3_9PEZI|nr:uncharacterized protein BCR38DRAFT_217547 [Pseudomassariella vexata]ORY62927.1 hypothetical protein BCR38DRAFT_217547 [Pseudomassariella vexata]